jgi:MoxR-like ATPase
MSGPVDPLLHQLQQVILGKERALRLAVCCLLARGHLLLEDVPGVGKTTLACALARSFGLQIKRVQFTSDLLPADIVGNSIFNRERQLFVFHPGPIFSQVVLADEVNRATPKTQSALLEAMEERRATIDGQTYDLPKPFFVIATQNPSHQIGTFPLPESQLDRFLMRLELGYPAREAERDMLRGPDRRLMVDQLPAVMTPDQLLAAQEAIGRVHVAEPLRDYILDLLHRSRVNHGGLSPRAGLALLRAAQGWAWMTGREMAIPDDVQAVGLAVMGHRLGGWGDSSGQDGKAQAQRLLETVAIP